jgi:hypothetical protein
MKPKGMKKYMTKLRSLIALLFIITFSCMAIAGKQDVNRKAETEPDELTIQIDSGKIKRVEADMGSRIIAAKLGGELPGGWDITAKKCRITLAKSLKKAHFLIAFSTNVKYPGVEAILHGSKSAHVNQSVLPDEESIAQVSLYMDLNAKEPLVLEPEYPRTCKKETWWDRNGAWVSGLLPLCVAIVGWIVTWRQAGKTARNTWKEFESRLNIEREQTEEDINNRCETRIAIAACKLPSNIKRLLDLLRICSSLAYGNEMSPDSLAFLTRAANTVVDLSEGFDRLDTIPCKYWVLARGLLQCGEATRLMQSHLIFDNGWTPEYAEQFQDILVSAQKKIIDLIYCHFRMIGFYKSNESETFLLKAISTKAVVQLFGNVALHNTNNAPHPELRIDILAAIAKQDGADSKIYLCLMTIQKLSEKEVSNQNDNETI